MPGDSKRYSIDNYDKLKPGDFAIIFNAFKDQHSHRLRIMRFLAKEAREEKYAKTRKQVARELDISEPAALDHLDALEDIGVIVQIWSKDEDNKERYQGPRKVIKYYLNDKNLIEILAILNAATLGLPKDAVKKIKEAITSIFNQNVSKFLAGIYGGKFLDMQEQILDAIRNIAHSYNEAQKGIVNWWCEVAQSNMRNYYSYYPWFYQPGFANMTSQAYRSMADYTISALNIAQNNFDAYIDMSKTYSGLIAGNINEVSKTAINSSKMFEPESAAPMLTTGVETISSTVPNMENEDDESSLYEWRKLRDDLTEIVQITHKGT
jgi:DNA-binding transcriptional ArsR family regulator